MTATVDNYTRILLTVITILLVVVSVGLWCETPSAMSSAYAGIPDSGQQMDQLIQKVDKLSQSLETLPGLLTSGKVKVQVVTAKVEKASDKAVSGTKAAK